MLARRKHVLMLVGALVVGACDASGSRAGPAAPHEYLPGLPPTASVQVAVATPGEPVPVLFTNSSASTFYFAACLRRVERRVGDAWVDIEAPAGSCGNLVVVPATGTVERGIDLPAEAQPGAYRFRFLISASTGSGSLVSTGPFRVE